MSIGIGRGRAGAGPRASLLALSLLAFPTWGCDEEACAPGESCESDDGGTADAGSARDAAGSDAAAVDASRGDACTGAAEICDRRDDDCDGEVDEGFDLERDPLHCGSCGEVCPAPEHAVASCEAAACAFACDAGYARLGEVCVEVLAPRPIAPLSTATVTSRRPTLRWELAAGTTGAHVELCADRACASPIASFDAEGESAVPSEDLPPGVVFWRLRGRVGEVRGLALGPTWQLVVGRRTAPVDTSCGSVLDLDGDGYGDVAIGAAYLDVNGAVLVHRGGPGGPALEPTATLVAPDPAGYFGQAVSSAGDVNGDGFVDLVVGAVEAPGGGRMYLYLGGPDGVATTPAAIRTAPGGEGSELGWDLAGVGDVDGDGYGDVLVGAPKAASAVGEAYLYRGGPGGLSELPATTLVGPEGYNDHLGLAVTGIGDANGDGYADVAVDAMRASGFTGRVHVYHGGPGGLSVTPAVTLAGDPTEQFFGSALASGGDLDADGYCDLLVGSSAYGDGDGAVDIYHGSADGIDPAGTHLAGPTGFLGYFGASVATAGDVDGDGYGDYLVGLPIVGSNEGGAALYLSGGTRVVLQGPEGRARFGYAVAGVGDMDGDGVDDVMVAAPYAELVQFHSGGAVTASATIRGADGQRYAEAIAGRE